MAPATPDLTPVQHQVIAALAAGATVTDAAEKAGVHRTTVHHWRRTMPVFAAALDDAQADVAEHWRSELVARADEALKVLDVMMERKTAPEAVRVRVALAILKFATTPSMAAPTANPLSKQKKLASAPTLECQPVDTIQHNSSLSTTEADVAPAPVATPSASPEHHAPNDPQPEPSTHHPTAPSRRPASSSAPSPLPKPSPNATRPTRAEKRAGLKERLDAALAQHRLKQGSSRSRFLPECP